VRGATVWLGLPDPGETRYLLQEQADITAEAMSLLLSCWEQMDPDRQGLTAAEVIDRLFRHPPESPPAWHAEMRAAVESLVGRGDSRALGNRLRTYRRRIFRGRFARGVTDGTLAYTGGAIPMLGSDGKYQVSPDRVTVGGNYRRRRD
jgi:hypothetical protein